MEAWLLSIEPSNNPQQYLVDVAVGNEEKTFSIQATPFGRGDRTGTVIEINSDLLHFLQYEHDLNTPILRAVGQYHRGESLLFPISLGKLPARSSS